MSAPWLFAQRCAIVLTLLIDTSFNVRGEPIVCSCKDGGRALRAKEIRNAS